MLAVTLEQLAEFRFYAELNDFLPRLQRKIALPYAFKGCPAIKAPIEAFGVPHTEVGLIIVNGVSVGFGYRLCPADRVAVYPVLECVDISPRVRLRERPFRRTGFVVDVNLGKLARRLRLLGFDALYDRRYRDEEIAAIAVTQQRIVLTRDRRLLFMKCITHGYWVRSVIADRQLEEVLDRFDLRPQIHPFQRCIVCNGMLEEVAKAEVFERLEPRTRLYYDRFHRCRGCGKIYWEGSHVEDMRQRYLRACVEAEQAGAPP